MTGLRARLATLTMLGLVAAGAFALATGTATASQQAPILECVFHDTGTGQYNSLWGYSNNGDTTTIAVGSNNKFSPTPQNRGQPTTILGGTHDNVFVVTWNGSGSLVWTLSNHTATATTSSHACSSNPVPMTGGLPWYVVPSVFLAVGILGLGICCRRFDLDLHLGLGGLVRRR
jgi:hypothetical protein